MEIHELKQVYIMTYTLTLNYGAAAIGPVKQKKKNSINLWLFSYPSI